MFSNDMNVSFAFSGPCNAGKTTLMQKIKGTFGSRVHVVGECIRGIVSDIDEVRKRPLDYLDLQKTIIEQKIAEEDAALDMHGKIILIDRSLADSLFYLAFCTNTSDFPPKVKERFSRLVTRLKETATEKKRYDVVFMLQPLPIVEVDPMRPKDLSSIQSFEHCMIETLNMGLFSYRSRMIKVDVREEENMVLKCCKDALEELP